AEILNERHNARLFWIAYEIEKCGFLDSNGRKHHARPMGDRIHERLSLDFRYDFVAFNPLAQPPPDPVVTDSMRYTGAVLEGEQVWGFVDPPAEQHVAESVGERNTIDDPGRSVLHELVRRQADGFHPGSHLT